MNLEVGPVLAELVLVLVVLWAGVHILRIVGSWVVMGRARDRK